jgi:hypothetical protein
MGCAKKMVSVEGIIQAATNKRKEAARIGTRLPGGKFGYDGGAPADNF